MTIERYDRGRQALAQVDGEPGVQVVEQLALSFPDFARYGVEFPSATFIRVPASA